MFRKILLFIFFLLFTVLANATVHVPKFNGGRSQTLGVCKDAGAGSINSLLAVIDSSTSTSTTDTWSVITAPLHGTLVAAYSAAATGGLITPAGLTYTPTGGYTGNDTFKVRVANSLGADTTTVYVTVHSLPSAIFGTAHMCPGLTASITDTTAGGTWTSSDISIATVGLGTGILTGHSSGTAVITYTIFATGCSAITTVTTDAAPGAIGGHLNVCKGLYASLTDTPAGGTWSSADTTIARIDTATGIYFGNGLGTANITYTLPDGCNTAATVTVEVTPSVISGTLIICAGSATDLSDAITGGTWSSSDVAVAIVGSGSGVVTTISGGTALITYTTPGCFVTSVLTVNPLPSPIVGGLIVIVGLTTSLTDFTSGGSWSSADLAITTIDSGTGVATGIAVGTAVITYTLGTGCAVSAVVTVVSTPTPIMGGLHVCQGATTALSDATPGGFWYSSHPAVAIVDSVTGIVTGVSIGTAYITYAIGTSLTASIVTVNALPGSILGVSGVCTGLTGSLSDASTGGNWLSSNTAVAAIGSASGIYYGISTGTSTITYTVSTGCFITQVVTVLASPAAITGTPITCQDLTTPLSDAVTGGTWTSSNAAVATIGSVTGLVTAVSSGTATIIYTLNTGCATSLIVTVNALPSAGSISGEAELCIDSTIALSDVATGGIWSSSNSSASVSIAGIVTGLSAGVDTIRYSVSNVCGTATASHVVIVKVCTNDRVLKINLFPINIYPNPATSILYIDASAKVNIAVRSMDGRVVLHKENVEEIDISAIANGIYLVQVFDETNHLLCTRKVIKEK